MLPEIDERFILIILAGDVGAHFAEATQLLLHLLSWGFDVLLHPPEVFLMIHLRTRVADDLDIFGEKVVAILECAHVR